MNDMDGIAFGIIFIWLCTIAVLLKIHLETKDNN